MEAGFYGFYVCRSYRGKIGRGLFWPPQETRYSRYTYQKKPDIDSFQQGIGYGDFKDLPIRTASDKILKILDMMKINVYLFQWFISKLFGKLNKGF